MSKSPSLRRIQADIRELAMDPSDRYHARPLENDMFEWHFTIRGADDTDFGGGIYHGRILLPPEYPFKPPNIVFLTPSGRFDVGVKVCLSFSAFHPELWQPAWGIRLILEALIAFLPTPGDGAIGALNWSAAERQKLARASVKWCCPQCGPICQLIPKVAKSSNEADSKDSNNRKSQHYQKEIAELQRLQQLEHAATADDATGAGEEKATAEESAPSETAPLEPREAEAAVATTSDAKDDAIDATATDAPALLNESTAEDSAPSATQAQSAETTADPTDVPATPRRRRRTTVDLGPFWLSDPVLQAILVVLAAIVYLLIRKLQALLQDLQALNSK